MSALFHLAQVSKTTLTPPSSSTSLNPSPPPPAITNLLSRYDTIFHEPHHLPPPCSITHHIHLPHSNPVIVKPYRYPFCQKTKLERQLATMLDSGLIRHSHSPFFSLVLLVKTKDDSWRCCVNYRALNAITLKDRFPRSTTDEFLDELGKASWFSND